VCCLRLTHVYGIANDHSLDSIVRAASFDFRVN